MKCIFVPNLTLIFQFQANKCLPAETFNVFERNCQPLQCEIHSKSDDHKQCGGVDRFHPNRSMVSLTRVVADKS